jgi:hypothetical protein
MNSNNRIAVTLVFLGNISINTLHKNDDDDNNNNNNKTCCRGLLLLFLFSAAFTKQL